MGIEGVGNSLQCHLASKSAARPETVNLGRALRNAARVSVTDGLAKRGDKLSGIDRWRGWQTLAPLSGMTASRSDHRRGEATDLPHRSHQPPSPLAQAAAAQPHDDIAHGF